ncbi:MAG TPA: hypothetical protein VNN62_19730 [Methylomirabilota bacterium]|nr:hypothetical protein [Methylomirabilota bacterium]
MYDLYKSTSVESTQRDAVHMSAAPLSFLLEGCSSPTAPEPVTITWEEFIRDLILHAECLLACGLDEETYVTQLVAQLKQVDPLTIPSWSELPKHQLWEVSVFRLAEGYGFPPHDHRHYNGVIFVLEGQVHIRSYDLLGPERTPLAGRRVCIRETVNRIFTAGEYSTLTTTRDNIHAVRGGLGGCRLLDIFTWLGPRPQSVFLKVDEQPTEPGTNLYWASFMS